MLLRSHSMWLQHRSFRCSICTWDSFVRRPGLPPSTSLGFRQLLKRASSVVDKTIDEVHLAVDDKEDNEEQSRY